MARLVTADTSSTVPRRALAKVNDRANIRTTSTPMRSLSPGSGSEQENPRNRVNKGKRPMRNSNEPLTPNSDDVHPDARVAKRRRTNDVRLPSQSGSEEEDENEDEPPTPPEGNDQVEDVTEELSHARSQQRQSQSARKDSSKTVRFYDPNQDEGERRELKRKSRALEREFIDNRDEYLRSGNDALTATIEKANEIFTSVKQTADATTDSRLMVSVSDVAHRKSAQLTLGDSAIGIDVDEFVSKCISFMRQGTRETQRAVGNATQRRRQNDDEEEDDVGDVLDWTYLGRHACFPNNLRPPVPGFLLGPLSLQKRARAATQRRARQRDDGRVETRPEALEREDLQSNETNTVRHVCGKIKARLVEHTTTAEAAVYREVDIDSATEEQISSVCRANRITTAGGPSLFDFVVHPTSFSQTVENLFYVSFLIKEGEVGVVMDDSGLPALVINTETGAEARQRKSTRRQAVFRIDYQTWKDLVEAFDIEQPLIPDRAPEGTGPSMGARGWYS